MKRETIMPFLGVLLLINGCSVRERLVVSATRTFIVGAMESLLAETDLELARSGMETELKLLEGLITLQPDDEELLLMAAKGFTGYAMLFVEDEDPNRAMALYSRARDYGLQALACHNRRFSQADLPYNDFIQQMSALRERDIPAVYWTAVGWAGMVNLQRSSPQSLADLPKVVVLMQWILDIHPDFYYSGPRWFFGSYLASIPQMLGGSLEQSLRFFSDATVNDGDKFLMGKYLFARDYAVQAMDRGLFERLLTEVINSPTKGPIKELQLINTIAKVKAQLLLDKMDYYFE